MEQSPTVIFGAPHVDLIEESGYRKTNYHARIAAIAQEIGPDCNRPGRLFHSEVSTPK